MKIVCAWCNKYMGEKDGKGVRGITHSVCEKCIVEAMAKVESSYPTVVLPQLYNSPYK